MSQVKQADRVQFMVQAVAVVSAQLHKLTMQAVAVAVRVAMVQAAETARQEKAHRPMAWY